MNITKEDIGRKIIYKPMDIPATVVIFVDECPWCMYSNGGAVGKIKDNAVGYWEFIK